jgi:mannose-1-phosphate guanylyltransferase/mannose-6-phosphate isomerase
MTIYPVIMCGGSGTRLWPASRPNRPKQFIPLIAGHSTFQNTVLRLAAIDGAHRPLVIGGVGHADWIRRNLAEIGREADILLEPEPRDSAAAVAAAAAWVAARDPDAVLAIVAADHHVPDADAFARAIETAAGAARAGWIVTLGVKPDHPATAYGYIAPGAPVQPGVLAVASFVEKPKEDRARDLVKAGCLWNSGNFITSARTLTNAFAAYAPAVGEAAARAVSEARPFPTGWRLGAAFLDAPKISFDYAVMEKTDRAAVAPIAFAWSDLGAWDSIWAAADHDGAGNAVQGSAQLIEVSNSLVRLPAGTPLDVTVLGLSNVVIVADETQLLVASLAASQAVKTAAERAPASMGEPKARLREHARRYDLWLRTAALPLWWTVGADHARGGYFDLLDMEGRPVAGLRRARVQTRQSFVYAQAIRIGAPGGWRAASEQGLAYMRAKYRRPDGLFRTSVDQEGAPLDESAYLYDHAFYLMASATLSTVADDPAALRAECEALLATIEQSMAHPQGGFREAGAYPFQANAHMHLLEASLAWIEAGGDARWPRLAEQIVDLALTRFIDADGGFLREFFDADWNPAPGADGRQVEPGHQFEWAWLMARWGRMAGSAEAATAARRLFECGTLGVDGVRSVAVDELDELDGVRSARARLWPQTEYLKAALMLARTDPDASRHDDYLAHAARAADGLWTYLDVPVKGLWRDKMLDDGAFIDEPVPASSLYHILGAILALADYAAG